MIETTNILKKMQKNTLVSFELRSYMLMTLFLSVEFFEGGVIQSNLNPQSPYGQAYFGKLIIDRLSTLLIDSDI